MVACLVRRSAKKTRGVEGREGLRECLRVSVNVSVRVCVCVWCVKRNFITSSDVCAGSPKAYED